MEKMPEKRAERRQEVPELQIIPLERPEIERGGTMSPDMTGANIGKILEEQQRKDEEKRKEKPHLNN